MCAEALILAAPPPAAPVLEALPRDDAALVAELAALLQEKSLELPAG